jgi:hypothetical protein
LETEVDEKAKSKAEGFWWNFGRWFGWSEILIGDRRFSRLRLSIIGELVSDARNEFSTELSNTSAKRRNW